MESLPSDGADLTRLAGLANADIMAEDSKTEQGDLSQLSFEDALRALETIVRRLESGDVPLDESISLYAQGEELRKRCLERLQAAEARIQKLTIDPTGAVTGAEPFGAD
ncbi:Exodeoxyribonuclease 7 small subunit [Sphingobium herbicidovorans NBRC 16415]|uniref:Exodeoxyribonuclease 7 small subunit n=2 Tax=Sphingobium herbicidovorans TaxID=76947 RepID=A0A086PF85_SPHHM|nr:Exodeoxyribonuclease 7 small subunit [Sphingobium herbicidovorans NBRC 16415]